MITTFLSGLPDDDNTAIVTPGATISYRELLSRVDPLAWALAGRGIGPERVCVVALERGADPIVAIAAVLRTGAAFLVVDVDLPDKRIEALARGGHALITSAALAPRFAALGLPGPTVLVDEAGPPVPLLSRCRAAVAGVREPHLRFDGHPERGADRAPVDAPVPARDRPGLPARAGHRRAPARAAGLRRGPAGHVRAAACRAGAWWCCRGPRCCARPSSSPPSPSTRWTRCSA
nr:hypothetical protein GCM10020092_035320 [Actinoplanes digitatis]